MPHHQDFAAKLFNNLPEALKKVQTIQMEMQKPLFLSSQGRLERLLAIEYSFRLPSVVCKYMYLASILHILTHFYHNFIIIIIIIIIIIRSSGSSSSSSGSSSSSSSSRSSIAVSWAVVVVVVVVVLVVGWKAIFLWSILIEKKIQSKPHIEKTDIRDVKIYMNVRNILLKCLSF